MSLPAETVFFCQECPGSSVKFDFSVPLEDEGGLIDPAICIEVDQENCGITFAYLDRDQVESLLDQLTQWLEVTK